MAIQKQNLPINFSGDIDTKTDPFQVAPNNFLEFTNAVRTVGGLFKKRNGFDIITTFSLPYATSLATFGGSLVGIGSSVQVYSQDTNQLIDRGVFQPIELSVLPAIRTSSGQVSSDIAIAPNGLACVVAVDSALGAIYQIIDSSSGAVIVPITVITSFVNVSPKVYLLGNYFFITFVSPISTVNTLQYIAIPYLVPTSPGSPTVISAIGFGNIYEASVSNGTMYIAWTSTTSLQIKIETISSGLIQGSPTLFTTLVQTDYISVTVDSTGSTPVIWLTYLSNLPPPSGEVYTSAFDSILTNILPSQLLYTTSSVEVDSITTTAINGVLTAFFDITYDYGFSGGVATGQILSATCTLIGPVIVTGTTLIRSMNLASKSFVNPINGTIYLLGVQISDFQTTFFLIDGGGNILSKLAYSNGSVPQGKVLSSVNLSGSVIQVSYLFKDSISSVNKTQGQEVGGIYSTSGINIAKFTLGITDTVSSETGGSLQLSGGFLWQFDGQKPVEQGFHLYPENLGSTQASGTTLIAQQYYYQSTYEWTDGAGNLNRSAPSIPLSVVVTGGSDGVVTVYVPTLRLTSKVLPNSVRIVIYRWSTANQIFYQITSISTPINNDTNSDFITYVDTTSDDDAIGNNIIYTTGGVIENIGAPATKIITLFDDRLWLVDAEDPNLLWFSKQVIEATPVEMSDLLTLYVAPTTSSKSSTGPITALAPMDDKLIIFKNNAAYYINGTGPDNTGANNQYSQPIFITGTVGCSNVSSIVLMTDGLMFQTNQGIWLLGRDLSTKYIGASVEAFNSNIVTSAVNIPETTQVRFTLDSGTELVYDYFYGKWDTSVSVPAISSVIYQGLHTYLNDAGQVLQETPNAYLDGTSPVNLSFTTSWYNLTGLQGYERAYYFYLLGSYISPHILTIQIYYDYETNPSSSVTINPNGLGPAKTLEQYRIFLSRQKCQAFKFSVTESYDSSVGTPAGAGLTLSGINIVYGAKKGYRPIPAAYSVGAS